MPLISKIESHSWRGWGIYALILTFLSAAGFTMVYPFTIMISGSLRTEMDESEMTIIPTYLQDDGVLYRKFLETKYNRSTSQLNQLHGNGIFSIAEEPLPACDVQAAREDLEQFMQQKNIPEHWRMLGGVYGSRVAPENLREIRDILRSRFHNDTAQFSRVVGSPINTWSSVSIPVPNWLSQRYEHLTGPIAEAYVQVRENRPIAEQQLVSVSGYFLEQMTTADVRSNVEKFAARHPGTVPIHTMREFVLPENVPDLKQKALRDEWIEFVKNELHPSFLKLNADEGQHYRTVLRENYKTIAELNKAWGSQYSSFENLPIPDGMKWLAGANKRDFQEFATSLLKERPEQLTIVGPEYAWRKWLTEKYHNIEALNSAHQSSISTFDLALLPMDQLEFHHVLQHKNELRWMFIRRNYTIVLREILTQGRPLTNTLIVCSGAVILGLLINPLAAYAMSRYQLSSTYKILLFLMATTAFPSMVTTVPQFLVMRYAGLLNTLGALVVPTLANGYMIFMLKGFFDSLPRDLYEAATIDGASEIRIFFQITLALSTPILAVLALGEFTAAYTAFLFPLVVCPRPELWTINVWLYQWQTTSSMSCVFASLIIAALPTILIFLVAQNVIMRGIVIPAEK